MALAAITELAGDRVIAAHLLGNDDRHEFGSAARASGSIDELDIDLVPRRHIDRESLARRNLAAALGQPGPLLVVDRIGVVPSLPREAERAACGDHILHELLRHRDVCLSRYRRIRAVHLLGVLTAGVRDLGIAGAEGTVLAADPNNAQVVYNGDSWGGGVARSMDDGARWRRAGLKSEAVTAFAFSSVPNTVYAATLLDGIFKSRDAGASWRLVGLTGKDLWTLAAARSGRVLYAADSDGGVYRLRIGR